MKKDQGRKYIYDLMDKKQFKQHVKEQKAINKQYARRFKTEDRIYGFNASETWSMDQAMTANLYERLCMYKEKASNVIDLTTHTIEVDGETMTHEQAIDTMIELGKFILTPDPVMTKKELDAWLSDPNSLDEDMDEDVKKRDAMMRFWAIWAKVVPLMWW